MTGGDSFPTLVSQARRRRPDCLRVLNGYAPPALCPTSMKRVASAFTNSNVSALYSSAGLNPALSNTARATYFDACRRTYKWTQKSGYGRCAPIAAEHTAATGVICTRGRTNKNDHMVRAHPWSRHSLNLQLKRRPD